MSPATTGRPSSSPTSPIDEPRERLHAALDKAGIARERFRPLMAGEVWDVPG